MKGSTWFNYWFTYILFVLSGNAFSKTSHRAGSKKKNGVEDPRVVGGFYAHHRDFPFIVSTQIYYASWRHHCGGSIVTPQVVLTACHCITTSTEPLIYRSPNSFRVVAGTGDLFTGDPNEQAVRVSRLEAHPRCRGGSWNYDSGVLILRGRLQFNYNVQPMKLFSTDINTAYSQMWRMEMDRKLCYSPGWGSYDGVNYGTKLKFTPVNLMSSYECDNLNCWFAGACGIDYWQLHQVCAIHPRGIFCYGDSGGPLVCNGQVFGVVSYHFGCKVGHPMTYTDIYPILSLVRKYLYRYQRRKAKKTQRGIPREILY